MPNPIPTQQRLAVRSRDKDRCLNCAGRGSEWHHRRKRGVKDRHTHCTCNGVLLCKKCHDWSHAHPVEARALGWIVSSFNPTPGTIPVRTWHGTVYLTCGAAYSNGEPSGNEV